MSQPLPRYHQRQQQAEDAQQLARILLETGDPAPPATAANATLPGDTRRLRGIPCVAAGVAGATPSTNPLTALIRKETRS